MEILLAIVVLFLFPLLFLMPELLIIVLLVAAGAYGIRQDEEAKTAEAECQAWNYEHNQARSRGDETKTAEVYARRPTGCVPDDGRGGATGK